MWNQRYSGDEYLFGTEAAAFLRREAECIPERSKVLSVADGEGRNSVFLAGLGHHVTAMENAPNAIAKARKLAQDRDVSVDFQQADIEHWDWAPEAYDAVVGIFIQFMDPEMRRRVFDGITRTLRPGGKFLLHGYTPKQLEYGTGGPKSEPALYTPERLRAELPGFEILRIDTYDAHVDEGTGHSGMSALIDYIGQKPA